MRGGSEKLWLPGSLGASEEKESCAARLAQSPTSQSPCGLGELCTLLQVKWIRVQYLAAYITLYLAYNSFIKVKLKPMYTLARLQCILYEQNKLKLTDRLLLSSYTV